MNDSKLDHQVIIIGAGISGIGAGIFLQKNKINDFVLLEKSDRLGGTWRDNTYPGVEVDIPSIAYSFSFEPNPNWSQVYAKGEEIQQYVEHCADQYAIREHIQFQQSVDKIVFDQEKNLWRVHLKGGKVLKSRYVISATGILNQPIIPNIKGIDLFKGKMMHSAQWDHDYDLTDKKVGVIGTGASAVQIVPAWPILQRVLRGFIESRIQFETWVILNHGHLPFVNALIKQKLRDNLAEQVHDPVLREKLTPRYDFGCKRPSISNTYWKTFNQQNVYLLTEGIQQITEKGIVSNDGTEHDLDLIILGTGFKTLEPGNSPSYEVYGLNNLELGQFWQQHRYQAYRGISVPNFPNYFMTFGPYTGGFNWFSMLESQLTYIVRCLVKAQKKGATYVEVTQQAHDEDFKTTLAKTKNTIFKSPSCLSANSYYFDRHADASLPSVITPLTRWISTRLAGHKGFLFK